MMRSPLLMAFAMSIALHLRALAVASLTWGFLRAPALPIPHAAAAVVMLTPVPHQETTLDLAEATPLRAPSAVEEDPAMSAPPPPEPMAPPWVELVTPPRVEKTAPPKPLPAPRPTGAPKPPPPRLRHPKPTLSSTAEEGGEAGAGQLFGMGDVVVVPGSGVSGGVGGRGRSGLGLGEVGSGGQVGGIPPWLGGAGNGVGDATQPAGGYQVKPRYPDLARRQGVQETVLVKALVTEQGRVEAVQVERSAGHADLDQSAVEAVQRWHFTPARRGQ